MARHDMAGKEGLNSGTAAATSTSAPTSVPAPALPGPNQGADFAMTRPLLDPENPQQSGTYQEEVRDGDGDDDDEEDLYDASRKVLKRSVKRSTSVSMEAQSAPKFHLTPEVDEEKKKKDAATNVPPGGGVLKRDLAYEKTLLRLEEGFCLLPERFYFGSFSEQAVSKIPRK